MNFKVPSVIRPGYVQALKSLTVPMDRYDWADVANINKGSLKAYIPGMKAAGLIRIHGRYLNWQNKPVNIYAAGTAPDNLEIIEYSRGALFKNKHKPRFPPLLPIEAWALRV